MEWYHYFSGFWAGAFLANAVPHYVNGVSGNGFPTPFAKPPGKGLSSPLINVVWALLNAVIGYILLRAGKVSFTDNCSMLIFFAGFTALSLLAAKNFVDKHKA